jgi:L-cysteine/cystine lyase
LTFEEARSEFPVLARLAYLNAGTLGPVGRRTVEAMRNRLQCDLERGRGGQPYYDAAMELRRRVRGQLAQLLHVAPERVALTSSSTDGCNIVLAGLDLDEDDEIVTTDEEHFGLLGALHASGARVRVARVSEVPASESTQAILEGVTPRTRLIALSHYTWVRGNSLFPDKVKEATDLPILVDGAQSVGAVEVEAADFDFYTVSGQKWLCGPESTGALYVRDPESLRIGLPSYFSQARYLPTGEFEPREGAARFDSGWVPLSSLAGFATALESAPDWRFDRTQQIALECWKRLGERYELASAPRQAGLVSFRVDGDPRETVARLYERGVVVRDIPGTGLVRVSCGYWTSDGDLDRLLEAL